MHKVFISYHHHNDQKYKDALCSWNASLENKAFVDMSVYTGDIDDNLSDEAIRVKIRDEYLKDSSVTIVLVGRETARRKHVDWEIYSSMKDGVVNKKSGILVVLLPDVTEGKSYHIYAPTGDLEKGLYPHVSNWIPRQEGNKFLYGGFEYIPSRIIESICNKEAKISITTWDDFFRSQSSVMSFIDIAHNVREKNEYDFTIPMRRHNS